MNNKIIKQLEMYFFHDVNVERFFKSKRCRDHEDLKAYMFNNLNAAMKECRTYNKHYGLYQMYLTSDFLSFAHCILYLLEDDDWKKLYLNINERHVMGTAEA